MIFEKLQALKSKLTEIQNRIAKVIESSEVQISYKREKIHNLEDQIESIIKLEDQIGSIIIKRNNEIAKLIAEEKEALADCRSELAEACVFGTYVVNNLMPILADITRRIIAKDIDYKIYDYHNPACTVIDNYNVYYSFEVLALTTNEYPLLPLEVLRFTTDKGFWPYVIAESPKPTEIELWLKGKPYAKISHFAETHQFAKYDEKAGMFNFIEVSDYVINNTPTYIKEFISYASNYRLEHDLKEISGEELKELEEKFLEKNKERYNGQARKKAVK